MNNKDKYKKYCTLSFSYDIPVFPFISKSPDEYFWSDVQEVRYLIKDLKSIMKSYNYKFSDFLTIKFNYYNSARCVQIEVKNNIFSTVCFINLIQENKVPIVVEKECEIDFETKEDICVFFEDFLIYKGYLRKKRLLIEGIGN
jgi:hypothetical protein